MTLDDVKLLSKFLLEEMFELLDVTASSPEEATELVQALVSEFATRKKRPRPETEIEQMVEQFDALIDFCYFCGDAGAKAGVDLDPLMDQVHEANMEKVAHTQIRREDGKICKPDGWQPADLTVEIRRQMNRGKNVNLGE